jgi:hypothetical protein
MPAFAVKAGAESPGYETPELRAKQWRRQRRCWLPLAEESNVAALRLPNTGLLTHPPRALPSCPAQTFAAHSIRTAPLCPAAAPSGARPTSFEWLVIVRGSGERDRMRREQPNVWPEDG